MSQTRFLAWGHGYHSLNGNTGEGADGAGKGDEFILNILSLRCQLATQVDISTDHLGINGLKHGSRIWAKDKDLGDICIYIE